MRKVYVWNNCEGSKRALNLFNEKSFTFTKINLSFQKVSESDLIDMANVCPQGLVGIINPLSSKLKELGYENSYKNFSKFELISLITSHPDVISYPIVLQYNPNKKPKRLIIGFNEAEWFNKLYDDPNVSTYYNNISASYQFDGCCFFDKLKQDKEKEFNVKYDSTTLSESDEKEIKRFLNENEFE